MHVWAKGRYHSRDEQAIGVRAPSLTRASIVTNTACGADFGSTSQGTR